MSNPGEWISFEELCARWPNKSAATLRRYKAQGLISFRQAVKRGRVEFNWRTVQRELAAMETAGVHADVAALAALPPDFPPDLVTQFSEVRELVHLIAARLGIQTPAPAVFAAKQSEPEPQRKAV